MPSSPSLYDVYKGFNFLRNNNSSKYLGILFLFYPIFVILGLLYYKPAFIKIKNKTTNEEEVSYLKLILWFMLFMCPMIIAMIFQVIF